MTSIPLLLLLLALLAVKVNAAVCAGAGKNLDGCFSTENCDDDDDEADNCVRGTCDVVRGRKQCSNEQASNVIFVFIGMMSLTNGLTLCCCIRVCLQKRRQNSSNRARQAKKAAKASQLAFHTPEFQHMRTQLLDDLNISLNCVNQWQSMPKNQYTDSLASDSDCQAVVTRFRLLSLGSLELMKDENELEALSERERDQILDSGSELHEAMTDSAAVLARTLISQGSSADAVQEDLRLTNAALATAQRNYLKVFPESLLDGIELNRDGTIDKRIMSKLERKALGLVPTFHDMPQVIDSGGMPAIFSSMRRFKCFYFVIEVLLLAALLAFLVQIDTKDNDDFTGRLDSPGGLGKPYLGTPPQYVFADNESQRLAIPFVFGFMHMALVMLGLVPLPICRGIWRDVVQIFPGIKKWMPIDEFDLLHKQLGTLCLLYIAIGAMIHLVVMSIDCLNEVPNSCLAFDAAVFIFFDPLENVVMLRLCIWPSWFLIFPLMYFARTGAPSPFDKIKIIRRWWFEICMYTHIVVGVVTLFMALIGRKEVFFSVILSWWFYVLDRVRDNLFFVRKATVRQKTLYADQRQLPVGFRISLKLDGALPIEAGMWCYIMVPGNDLTWHPFSIASSSGDEYVDFHIGIHPRGYGKWVQNQYSEWEHTEKSWTYKLYRQLAGSRASQARDFTILVRGPYGAAFLQCFDPHYGGSVVIGAGTGLTAAESVLREFLHRKALDMPCPARLWFLWSCTNVDDMFWCWDQLLGLISAAVQAGVLRPLRKQRGALLDWLGVTIYLTRGSDAFSDFVEIQRAKFTADTRDVGEWLLQRIYRSSMDDKHTHIESLLRGAHRVLRQTPQKRSRDLALGFCGPPALAHIIERAAHRSLPEDAGNVTFNFSMDHQ